MTVIPYAAGAATAIFCLALYFGLQEFKMALRPKRQKNEDSSVDDYQGQSKSFEYEEQESLSEMS